jgi:hypothetical protein
MSERKRGGQSPGALIEWTPISPPEPAVAKPPSGAAPWYILSTIFGVVLPVAVIVTEWLTGLCAQAFFDPIPTMAHVALVSLVPAMNAAGIFLLGRPNRAMPRWQPFLTGVALAVSAFYALVFLPLMPLAVVAVMFYGLGLLPMGPVVSFAVALKLRARLAKTHSAAWRSRRVWQGVLAGLALLLALDVQPAATRLGLQWATSNDPETQSRGISTLRTFGDQDQLLRLCYDNRGRPTGLLSFLVTYGRGTLLDDRAFNAWRSPEEIREVFYRTYGVPFNALPVPFQKNEWAPRWARLDNRAFDADQGGTVVGSRVKGLSLVSSKIDGSISGDDAVAYLEWTIEVRNPNPLNHEARIGLAMPPGAVVSRATLWVNGEEREAAYAGRGAVRQAYERVAIRQARDPLLVTTKGADRVLAQAFPVPGNGGTIKFKIGITAPVDLLARDRGVLTLPAVMESNFDLDGTQHAIWIEGKRPLSIVGSATPSELIEPGRYRVTVKMSNAVLSRTRMQIATDRDPAITHVVSRGQQTGSIMQTITSAANATPSSLMLVVDTSLKMADHRDAILAALARIPEGTRVGLALAGDTVTLLPVAPLTKDHARAIEQAITNAAFVGGQDNTIALADALTAIESDTNAALLWVHGPQPVAFRGSAGRLEQAGSRLARYPKITAYAVDGGPSEVLPDAPWAWNATLLPRVGTTTADLEGFFEKTLDPQRERIKVERRLETAGQVVVNGSEHIARLWARDEIQSMMQERGEAMRDTATQLAADNRLVTPVSGAVVLETQQQFADNNLNPVKSSSVPTVPEPHEWAMIILASLMLLWMAWKQRQMRAGLA